MGDNPLAPLLQSLDHGLKAGADTRRIIETELLEWDEESNTGLVSMDGGDPTWLLAAADTHWPDVVGSSVIVERNEWQGKGSVILGPRGNFAEPEPEPDVRPLYGTVTAIPGANRVRVTADGESFTAPTPTHYIDPTVGDTVILGWQSDGEVVVVVGEKGPWTPAPPSTPPRPSLSRSGGTLTISWPKPDDVDTTRVRWRYRGGQWTVRKGLTKRSTTISISEGRTREVQIAQTNAGGTSDWSETRDASRPNSAPPPKRPGGSSGGAKTKTVTKTIGPTSTGTFRHAVNRWDDWNRGRYGYPNSLYQGGQYGSGDMTGLATYGSRITGLRAIEILKIEVRLVDARLGDRTVGQPIRVQTCHNGSRPSGAPALGVQAQTTSLGKGDAKWLNLGLSAASLEAYRTGDLRGLVINGGPYRAVHGRGTSGMTLRVTYRRRA